MTHFSLLLLLLFSAFAQSNVIERLQILSADQARFSHREMKYRLVVPPRARAGERFPVIYWLPGKTTPLDLDNFYQSGFGYQTYRAYQAAVNKGQIRDAILVYVDSDKPSGYWGDFLPQILQCPPSTGRRKESVCPGSSCPEECANGEATFDGRDYQIETAVIRDLMPFIESNYPVLPGSENRMVIGYSMGGYGAILYGLKYPDLFTCAVSVDGALMPLRTIMTAEPATWQYYYGANTTYFSRFDLWGQAETFSRLQGPPTRAPEIRFAFTQGGLFATFDNFEAYWTRLGLDGTFRAHPEITQGRRQPIYPELHRIDLAMARDGEWTYQFAERCFATAD